MKIGKPNIHIMELYGSHFLYDVNTNAICLISLDIYSFFQKLLYDNNEENNFNSSCIPENIKEDIIHLLDQGYLKPINQNVKIEHFESNMLKHLYDNNLNTIILQVTQNCNLRCEYCVYSGSYVNRVHNNKRMSIETAKKAINYLALNSSNSEEISIGFYGGEPLLEMDLIRELVEYAESLFLGKKILFNMTTNATLLNFEIAEYLYNKEFNLTISLDGPKNIHDKNRVFAKSNQGTFNHIINNIQTIREKLPDFCKNIGFNAVIDLRQNVSCSSEFFLKYDTVKDMNVSANYINHISRKEEMDMNPELYAISYYEIFKVYLYSCNKNIFKNYYPTLYGNEIIGIRHKICERYIGLEINNRKISPGGQCLPGIQRFFVTVDGEFFPCERVDEESEDLCIGNLTDGINVKNAERLLNIAQITAEQCKNCWCYKLCDQCIAKAAEDGTINSKSRLSWCNQTKLSVEDNIKNYVILKKYGCNFEEMGE